jgi:ubiquinone/menaquinone biosynthesis C-methylase UbiE
VNHDEMVAGVRKVFDLVAADYDNVGVPFFQPIAAGLVEAVGAAHGDRALDLGCGNGVSSRALAAAVAPDGSLVGIDLSAAMVDRARLSLDGALSDVTFLVGDASDPKVPAASFDVVIASLVVFFLPDPAAAVSRWVRLLRPGGRIGLSTFGPSSPVWQALEGHLREFMPPMDPRMLGPQSPFATDAGMAELLRNAGAVRVQTSSRRVEFAFAGFDQWVRFSRSVGQRVAWERMSAADTSRVLEQTRRTFDQGAAQGGTLPAWQEVRYTVGSAP